MTPQPNDDDKDVNRLHDIVVEEVSLVDHAANKHRFLIVKRSDDMNTNDTKDDPILDLDDDDDAAKDSNADDPEGDDAEEATEDVAQNAATLSLAVAALEGLTETVELLGAANPDEASSRLAELASELRGVSEQLVSMAGTPGSQDEDATGADADEVKGKEPAPAAAKDDALAGTISAVRATLQQVGGLLRGQGAATADKPTVPKDPPATDNAGALGEHLKALTTELRALTTTVKAQQQRLARLEKRVGMPNSKTAGEQPRRRGKDKDDEGWPLDMNRSLDRDSVDKSISFHDV